MFKLLLCSAIIAPCVVLPFVGSTQTQMNSYDTVSFREAYIEPEFRQLENCETAELDVYFYDNYITYHSAEYIAEGIQLSSACGNAKYVITPIIPSVSRVDALEVLDTQTKELLLVLKAHGISATVRAADVQKDFDGLSANGRTAKLEIAFENTGPV